MMSLAHSLLASVTSSASSSSSSQAYSSASSAASVTRVALTHIGQASPSSPPSHPRGTKRKGELLSPTGIRSTRPFEIILPQELWNIVYSYIEKYHSPTSGIMEMDLSVWRPGEFGAPLCTLPTSLPLGNDKKAYAEMLEDDNEGLLEALVLTDPNIAGYSRKALLSYNQKTIEAYFNNSLEVLRTLEEKCKKLSESLTDPKAKEWHLKTAENCELARTFLTNFQTQNPKRIHKFLTDATTRRPSEFTVFDLEKSKFTQTSIDTILDSIVKDLFDFEEEREENENLLEGLFPKDLSKIISGKELAYLFRANADSNYFISYVSALLALNPEGRKHLDNLCQAKEFRLLFQPILLNAIRREEWNLVEWMSIHPSPEIRAAFLEQQSPLKTLLFTKLSFKSIERFLKCLQNAIEREFPNDPLTFRRMGTLLFKYSNLDSPHPFALIVGAHDHAIKTPDGEATESIELFHFFIETCQWETTFSPREILECFDSNFIRQVVSTGTIELLDYLFSSSEPNLSAVLKRQQALYPEELLVTTAEGRKNTCDETFDSIRELFPPDYFDECLKTNTPLDWKHALDYLIPPDLAHIAASCNNTDVLDWIAKHPNREIRDTLEYVDSIGTSMAEIALLEETLHDFMQSAIDAYRVYEMMNLVGIFRPRVEIPAYRDRVIPWMKSRGMAPETVGDLYLDSGAVYKMELPDRERLSLYHKLKLLYDTDCISRHDQLYSFHRDELVKLFRVHRRISLVPD